MKKELLLTGCGQPAASPTLSQVAGEPTAATDAGPLMTIYEAVLND